MTGPAIHSTCRVSFVAAFILLTYLLTYFFHPILFSRTFQVVHILNSSDILCFQFTHKYLYSFDARLYEAQHLAPYINLLTLSRP